MDVAYANLNLKEIQTSPLFSEGSAILQGISRRIEGRAYNIQAHVLYACALMRGDCNTYLELGTMHGATMCLMSRVLGCRAPLAIGVDWFSYYHRHPADPVSRMEVTPRVLMRNFSIYNPGQRVHLQLVKGDTNSEETVAKVRELLSGRGVDVMFIDATYTPEHLRKNFEMYKPVLASGAVIVFSGYDIPEVKEWLDKLDPFGYNIVGSCGSMFILQKMKRLYNRALDSSSGRWEVPEEVDKAFNEFMKDEPETPKTPMKVKRPKGRPAGSKPVRKTKLISIQERLRIKKRAEIAKNAMNQQVPATDINNTGE